MQTRVSLTNESNLEYRKKMVIYDVNLWNFGRVK